MDKRTEPSKSLRKWRKAQVEFSDRERERLQRLMWEMLQARDRGMERFTSNGVDPEALIEFEDARYELLTYISKLCRKRSKVEDPANG